MAQSSPALPGTLTTADGIPLKLSLQRAQRRNRRHAFFLVAPLLAFIAVTFLLPIGDMLLRSVQNPELVSYMPHTLAVLKDWDGQEVPGEEAFAALAQDLKIAFQEKNFGKLGTRLNYEKSGAASLVRKSARRAARLEEGPYREALLKIDKDWGDIGIWRLIQREGHPYTNSYLLAAVDFQYNDQNEVVALPENQRIHILLFQRTFILSLVITLLTILLAYPISYLLANLPARKANLLMILVLLPFWTSLLVRTTSWIVMLQTQGVLNDLLVWIGVLDDENRLQMIFNQTGTIIAMTHILLPFMVLPLYSVMKTIPPNYLRAARSLGANPFTAFWKVYLPQTVPGVSAGSVLVFILAIGYFITPALVGGRTGQLISNRIAFHMQESLNWGLAAALGGILLVATLLLYILYNRLVGVDKVKLG